MVIRKSFPQLLLFVGIASFIVGHSFAATPSYNYIIAESLPPVLLDPPPIENSNIWKKEVEEVLSAQKNITLLDRSALKEEQHFTVESMTFLLGPSFTRERYPKTYYLLDRAYADATAITETDKAFWHSRRPYLTEHSVKLLVSPLDKSPSYPSGHACESRVLAEVLGMLYPNRRLDFRKRSETIAWHRVEAGVHYPIDIESGKKLAMLIVGAFTQSDDFEDDFTAARDEIAPTK